MLYHHYKALVIGTGIGLGLTVFAAMTPGWLMGPEYVEAIWYNCTGIFHCHILHDVETPGALLATQGLIAAAILGDLFTFLFTFASWRNRLEAYYLPPFYYISALTSFLYMTVYAATYPPRGLLYGYSFGIGWITVLMYFVFAGAITYLVKEYDWYRLFEPFLPPSPPSR